MLTLRLTQITEDKDKYRVEVALEGEGLSRQTATARLDFKLTPQEQEQLRWYLEDFLQYPHDPGPKIAAGIEKRMAEIGRELFKAVFHANDDARDLWATFRTRLNEARIEIITGIEEAVSIPWELICDPKTDRPLALRARSFVYALPQPRQTPKPPQGARGPIRILLVICRPGGRQDVPFRSVAGRFIKGLDENTREAFQLDVLRPPTFAQLGRKLRDAQTNGQPYHIVHFDGHGAFLNMKQLFKKWQDKTSEEMMDLLAEIANINPHQYSPEAIYPGQLQPGNHGYLVFENPQSEHNLCLVDGQELGKLLADTNTPVLVLNACRSAYAEPPTEPEKAQTDPHTQVQAFGSLAQEVMDAGASGVVAMRYNVYAVTAAQFVADLYAKLALGHALGEAVTLGRKQLSDNPLRTIAYNPLPLQDWTVPVVYEAAPIQLFPKPARETPLDINIAAGDTAPVGGNLDPGLPKRPDAGFFGRDETLLALDRAFDNQTIVLLHAYAGSGKTATAAEFARWYALTGGVEGAVLFTSFERHKPLAGVLNQLGQMFEPLLEGSGIQWLALSDEERREVALQVLKQIPVLWIWDNVEPIAGFPAGNRSRWSKKEQRELADFLRDARETQAKFLLTSRRDEQLGDLPMRITIPPMPTQERVQLARALVEKHNRSMTEVEDWMPLLQFTRGNPLTITVLVSQALRDGLKTKEQIETFVAQLRAGEAEIEDEKTEGRAKSLRASLSYGFGHNFNEDERKQLALLHFFQGFVSVSVLQTMGHSEADWCLPEVRGLTREAGISLLDRAAEIGLLTAHVGGYYTIHPALPWYFRSLFEQYYEGTEEKVTQAFVEAMGELGDYYHNQYVTGNRDVIAALTAEEANLLHARQLARTNGWWGRVISTMQGLRPFYDQTGRRADWARLVEEMVPDFVDPDIDGPLPGMEGNWSVFSQYRVHLAEEARQWEEAERLQSISVEWDRQRAAPALDLPPETLDDEQRNVIRSLAVSLNELGAIERKLGQLRCVKSYEESLSLKEKIGERTGAAISAFNLGHAYMKLPAIRDLAKAEDWYRRSLELCDEGDRLGRSKVVDQIGIVIHERFQEAKEAGASDEQLLEYANEAIHSYQLSLELTPPDAVDSIALSHQHLGSIYDDVGHLDRALPHHREAIRYFERSGNLYAAATTRFNVAVALANVGRFVEALEYADAALRNYQTFGDRAAEDIKKTQVLTAIIKEKLQ